jgi:glyoxylase-like metal-dependent hydrolase (beta-lactamase superfamily II)
LITQRTRCRVRFGFAAIAGIIGVNRVFLYSASGLRPEYRNTRLTPILLAAAIAVAAPRFTLSEIAPGVFAALADPADGRTLGNAGFVIGSEAVLVVDAFASEEAAERLLAEIRSRTKLPVRFAVLTHFHSDHIGGAGALAKAGATILGHEGVRAWGRRDWQTDLDAKARERYAGLRLPDMTYRDRVTVRLGDREIEIFHRPGHSGSDSLVAVPDARVLFGGDLVQRRTLPGLTYARTEAWVGTLDELLREDADGTFVPGHGSLARALDVRLFRDYLNGLRLAVSRALSEGKRGTALLEAVKPQLAARYGTWAEFEQLDRNVADMEKELTGTKAYPPALPR